MRPVVGLGSCTLDKRVSEVDFRVCQVELVADYLPSVARAINVLLTIINRVTNWWWIGWELS